MGRFEAAFEKWLSLTRKDNAHGILITAGMRACGIGAEPEGGAILARGTLLETPVTGGGAVPEGSPPL